MFQARPGTTPSAQPPGRSPPSATGGNVFTTLSLASAFASTTLSAPHAASSVFSQPTPGLLPPPVKPGVQTAPDRTTQGSISTGQHSDAFTSWSHPASATGQSPWTITTEVFLDEGPSVHGGHSAFGGPSAQGPSTAFPLARLIDPQIFATMQFEGPPLLHTRALHVALEGMGYLLEERLPPAERPGQHDLSTAAYLQIAAEIPPNRIIVFNLEKFQRLVSATLIDLYPMFARYAAPLNLTVERPLEISHLVVREPTHILSREPPVPLLPVPSSLLASAHPLPQPAKVYKRFSSSPRSSQKPLPARSRL